LLQEAPQRQTPDNRSDFCQTVMGWRFVEAFGKRSSARLLVAGNDLVIDANFDALYRAIMSRNTSQIIARKARAFPPAFQQRRAAADGWRGRR
jgi:hypothetical protein